MNWAPIMAATLLIPAAVIAGETSGPIADSSDTAPRAALSWSATYASRYSFQGLDYSDGQPVFQPEISGGTRGASLVLWANCDRSRLALNELDVSLTQEYALGKITGSVGYMRLYYPNREWEPTQECFTDLALTGRFEPSVSLHWDVDAGRGRYWSFALSREITLGDLDLSLATKLHVHDHYYGLTGIPSAEARVGGTLRWMGLALQLGVSRFATWANGDFRDDQAVPGGWLLSLGCAGPGQ